LVKLKEYNGIFQIVKVERWQGKIEESCEIINKYLLEEYGNVYWYTGGVEHKSSANLLYQAGINVQCLSTHHTSKMARAQQSASAWRKGNLQIPKFEINGKNNSWLIEFIDELTRFTGSPRDTDDQ